MPKGTEQTPFTVRMKNIKILPALGLLCNSAWSQEDSTRIEELAPFFATPSRVSETDFDAPYHLYRVNEADLVFRSVRSVPEIFEDTPGVVVQKTAHGQGSPYIRGFTAYNNLFLIDGIRLNNAAFRSGPNQYWNTVDSQGLRAVELVKSQGSVIYGSDAVGGTVQAFTRDPLYADQGIRQGGRSYSRFSNGENSFIQRGEVFQSEAGKYGVIVGGTYKDFGDIEAAGLGKLPFTGYDEHDFDTKLEYFLAESTQLTFFHQQVNIDDAWRTHKTIFGQSWEGTAVGDERARILDQDRTLSYIQLRGIAPSPFFESYALSLSYQSHGEERYRERGNGRVDIQGFDLSSYGAWGQFEKDAGNTDIVYGASYYQDQADSYRSDWNADGTFRGSAIQGPIGDDAIYHLFGTFFNTKTLLSERLSLDLGARYTHAQTNIGRVEDPATGNPFSIKDNWDNLVGSGRISYRMDTKGRYRLFGGISQAFRSPNFSDLSRLDSNRSNEVETPSPGLEPEEFLTFETGIKANTGRLSGSLSYYYTKINNMILRTPTGNILDGGNEVIKSNVGDGFVQGIELQGSISLDGSRRIFGGFAYQDSSVSTYPTSDPILRDEYLSRNMPTNGFLGIRHEMKDGQIWMEALATVVGKGDRLSTSDIRDDQRIPPGGTPSYWLATLRGGYRIKENLLLTMAVENLFDEEYRAHGSGQNEPGINFIFGAEYKF